MLQSQVRSRRCGGRASITATARQRCLLFYWVRSGRRSRSSPGRIGLLSSSSFSSSPPCLPPSLARPSSPYTSSLTLPCSTRPTLPSPILPLPFFLVSSSPSPSHERPRTLQSSCRRLYTPSPATTITCSTASSPSLLVILALLLRHISNCPLSQLPPLSQRWRVPPI